MKNLISMASEYFDLVGIAKAERPPTIDIYSQWLQRNEHGEMEYLRRHLAKKEKPQELLKNAKSWIVLAHYYDTAEPLSTEIEKNLRKDKKGWISRYARSGDYHHLINEKLQKLIAQLKTEYPKEEFLPCVDTKPVLERDTALRAGLGWIGKNTCLINTEMGSFVFLAEILTTMELESAKPETDHCGTCTRCLDACPTGALESPRHLNATKCISYWTIENKNPPPKDLAEKFGINVFGCDICQDVCPWNQKARRGRHLPAAPDGLKTLDLRDFVKLNLEQVKAMIKNSALERAGAQHLLNNACIGLNNSDR